MSSHNRAAPTRVPNEQVFKCFVINRLVLQPAVFKEVELFGHIERRTLTIG